MKKLLFIFGLLAFVLGVSAQNSTIVDNGTYIAFNYDNGDTVCIGKNNVVLVKDNGNHVFIMTNHSWKSDRITKIIELDPTDFGYSAPGTLRDYLSAISFRAYLEVYSYENGNLDTVSFYQGADRQYRIVYGYTDALITSKKILAQ